MTIEFIWQLPTAGDGRYGSAAQHRRGERASAAHPYSPGVSDPRGSRLNYFDYLHQVARAADLAGFDGIRIPDDPAGDEPWIVAGYVSRGTRRLKLLTEFDAARGSAVYAAKNAASYQRFTGGRFAWQVGAGGSAHQRRALGDFAVEEDLYPRIEEFITVARGVLTQAPYSYEGRFFTVRDGGFHGALGGQKVPPVYLSGTSPAAHQLSARLADVHVFDAAPAEALADRVSALRELAGQYGRTLGFGVRIDLLARESEEEAVFDAYRYWEQAASKRGGGDPLIAGRLWHGLTANDIGNGTGAVATLVGSHEQLAQLLSEYVEAGIDSFLLSGIPHLEDAYRVGEYVLPAVRARIAPERRRAV